MDMLRVKVRKQARKIAGVVTVMLLLSPVGSSVAGTRSGRGGKSKAVASRSHTGATAAKERSKSAAAIAASKAVVFDFKGEEVDPLRTRIVKILRAQGMEVLTHLRAPDSPRQFREMSVALGLAIYIHGQVREGAGGQATAKVSLRSGSSGQVLTTLRFSGPRAKITADLEEDFWPRIERAVGKACLAADKPGRRFKPMRIDAGTPIEDAKPDRTGS